MPIADRNTQLIGCPIEESIVDESLSNVDSMSQGSADGFPGEGVNMEDDVEDARRCNCR